MALVSKITKKVDIPHEHGEWIEFRKLSWKQLEKASDIASEASLDRIRKLGGDMVSALRKIADDQDSQPEAKYDQGMILKMGIVSWSYDAEVSPETIEQLDSQTAEWAMNQILLLNEPKTEDEIKND